MKQIFRAVLALAMLFGITSSAKADITDGHFSTNQIFDVQYYWSGTTLNASNFIAPYDMNFQHPTVSSGQYFAFFNSTTNPGTYGLGLYNSDGTLAQVVHNTGTLQAIGPDALFYVGSGFFGTVITTSAGYAYGSSASFTNMDTSVSAADASGYTWASTTPLGAGQTAGGGGGAPTVVSTAAGTPIVNSTSSVGATTNVTTTTNSVSENNTTQSVTTTTTVASTTPTTTNTCTTPTTVTTYSDGSTTTTNGSTTCASSTTNASTTSSSSSVISGRIDQYAMLDGISLNINRSLNHNIMRQDGIKYENGTFYINGGIINSKASGYNADGKQYGFAIERNIRNNWSLGVTYNNIITNMSGVDSSANMTKNHIGLYSIYRGEKMLLQSDLGYVDNTFSVNRNIENILNNSSSSKGSDMWLSNRIYSIVNDNIRPFIGYTYGRTNFNGYTETGSLVSARTVAGSRTDINYGEAGLQVIMPVKRVNVFGELSTTTDSFTLAGLGIAIPVANNGALTVTFTNTHKDGISNHRTMAGIRIRW